MNKNLIFLSVFLFMVLIIPVSQVHASEVTGNNDEPYSGQPLCFPGAPSDYQDDCLPLGPAAIITDLAAKGIQYPAPPLPVLPVDTTLVQVPISIAKINLPNTEAAPLYSSLEDAINGGSTNSYLPPGRLIYVSYLDRVNVDGKNFIRLKTGQWMRGSPIAGYSHFQGLPFSNTPDQSIGWIIRDTQPRKGPGYQHELVNEDLFREKVVNIYDIQEVNGTKWFMIGLNRWVEDLTVSQLVINTNPPEGVTGDRWIELNLFEQTLSVYDNRELVFATLITSGAEPYYTRPGLFQIYEKKPLEDMTGAFEADRSDLYLLHDVPWTMYYDKSRAIHGTYWRAMFGHEQSAGCVNLSVGDSRWLYDWAEVGDWVYVWDPSGRTPTDPSLYTEGGA